MARIFEVIVTAWVIDADRRVLRTFAVREYGQVAVEGTSNAARVRTTYPRMTAPDAAAALSSALAQFTRDLTAAGIGMPASITVEAHLPEPSLAERWAAATRTSPPRG